LLGVSLFLLKKLSFELKNRGVLIKFYDNLGFDPLKIITFEYIFKKTKK